MNQFIGDNLGDFAAFIYVMGSPRRDMLILELVEKQRLNQVLGKIQGAIYGNSPPQRFGCTIWISSNREADLKNGIESGVAQLAVIFTHFMAWVLMSKTLTLIFPRWNGSGLRQNLGQKLTQDGLYD